MYPKISDFFNDIFGWDICLPIQSFGFFMAMAFVVAYFIIIKEYARQTRMGIFPSHPVTIVKGGPIKTTEVGLSFLLYAILGYKLVPMFFNYNGFCDNPQEALLSMDGSWVGALVVGGIAGGIKLYQYLKAKDTKAVEVVEQHSVAEEMGVVFVIAFVVGVIGAKLFHNLENLDAFFRDPIGQLISFSGLTFYGGLIGAGTAIGIYIKRKGYALLPFIDTASLVLILGYGIGRIGCQISGDGDWGIVNLADKPGWLSWAPDWLWSYNYPNNVLQSCGGGGCNWAETPFLINPVFPTPIYETTMAFAIFGFLWFMRKRLPYWGQLFSIYLILNGLERFLIEKIRVNPPFDFMGMQLTQAEIISFCLIIAGCVFMFLTTFVWKQSGQKLEVRRKERGGNNG